MRGGKREGAGRKPVFGVPVQYRLPEDMIEFIREHARRNGCSQSEMLKEIVTAYRGAFEAGSC